MDIKYYRDSSHNYLLLDAGCGHDENYQYRMLENNRIEGILPFSVRTTDGKAAVYYEIDSRQSLENRYLSGKMDYDRVVAFLKALDTVSERLSEYFLDAEGLIMRKDCIFEDLSAGSFHFVYHPQAEGECSSPGEILLDMADMEDERTAALICKVCERTDDLSIGAVMAIRDILKDVSVPQGAFDDPPLPERTICYDDPVYEDDTEDEDDEPAPKRIRRVRLPFGMSMVMAALFAVVAGALWYLRAFYILTYEENLLDLAILMLSVMMSLICLVQGFSKRKKAPAADEDYEDDEDNEDNGELFEEKDEDNEETVFLGMDINVSGRKLFGCGEQSGMNIPLERACVTVGKLSNAVDAVLRDPSVSRIHARIFRAEDDYFVQDLNSKNGTYVNGKRLMPNEKSMILPEDEVAFGRCVFCYR